MHNATSVCAASSSREPRIKTTNSGFSLVSDMFMPKCFCIEKQSIMHSCFVCTQIQASSACSLKWGHLYCLVQNKNKKQRRKMPNGDATVTLRVTGGWLGQQNIYRQLVSFNYYRDFHLNKCLFRLLKKKIIKRLFFRSLQCCEIEILGLQLTTYFHC